MTAVDRPLIDPGVLRELADDVGPAVTLGMVRHFLDMLEERLTRIRTAGDDDELEIAVLSLGCSASMLGAEPLARSARALRLADRAPAGSDTGLAPAFRGFEELARRTARELGAVHEPCGV